jgi:hypothetical protein
VRALHVHRMRTRRVVSYSYSFVPSFSLNVACATSGLRLVARVHRTQTPDRHTMSNLIPQPHSHTHGTPHHTPHTLSCAAVSSSPLVIIMRTPRG